MTWHRRLGHLSGKDLSNIQRDNIVDGLGSVKLRDEFECTVCVKGKMTRTPFPRKSERSTNLLEIIHSDVCGPMRQESHGGAKYFVEFIDDNSRWCEVRFVRSKDEVMKETKEFITLVENQKQGKVKCLQSDNGTEYLSNEFTRYLKEKGITRRLTVPYNPEQNGVAERKNRSLLDTARCLLLQSGLPPSFWAEAVNTANYIQLDTETKSLNGNTPYEAWTNKIPNVSYLREFGCRVLILRRQSGRGKFEPRAKEGIFVGYDDCSKGYRIWIPSERKIEVTRDVKFMEEPDPPQDSFEEFAPEHIGIGPTFGTTHAGCNCKRRRRSREHSRRRARARRRRGGTRSQKRKGTAQDHQNRFQGKTAEGVPHQCE